MLQFCIQYMQYFHALIREKHPFSGVILPKGTVGLDI